MGAKGFWAAPLPLLSRDWKLVVQQAASADLIVNKVLLLVLIRIKRVTCYKRDISISALNTTKRSLDHRLSLCLSLTFNKNWVLFSVCAQNAPFCITVLPCGEVATMTTVLLVLNLTQSWNGSFNCNWTCTYVCLSTALFSDVLPSTSICPRVSKTLEPQRNTWRH